MKKAISLLLALSALLLCLVGCDSNKKSKLVEIERFSSMTLDGTTSIEVIYDYTKDGYATYEFVIEDREMIREIMTALFEVKLKDYPEDRDIDFYQRWLNVKQGETVYYVNLSYAADENENRYLLDSQAVCEIIEKYIEENLIQAENTDSGYQSAIKMMRYNWDGYGISTKRIETSDLVYAIIDAAEKLTETGETVEKISDAVVDENSTELPIERGTLWLEIGSKIYRIDPDFEQLCRVDGHLGRGYVMNASEQFKKMIINAWQYYPYDYYAGNYNNETNEIKLNHVYNAPSTVQVQIKKVEIVNDYDPKNKITLELISTVDQSVSISLLCSQSNDNLADGDRKEIVLTAEEPEAVELTFGGWKDFNYWIDISIDNTRINLRIEP